MDFGSPVVEEWVVLVGSGYFLDGARQCRMIQDVRMVGSSLVESHNCSMPQYGKNYADYSETMYTNGRIFFGGANKLNRTDWGVIGLVGLLGWLAVSCEKWRISSVCLVGCSRSWQVNRMVVMPGVLYCIFVCRSICLGICLGNNVLGSLSLAF